ncbi:hypothetical protein [uncultured Clostridium sp.]|uniref:hypothetical protein n=1 Tax=uncultured Clostridium sp. TaxID=59620 RepID=UPI0025902553|nr:hypothetical protein [uncultured Clostridium sp.]
MKNNVLRTKGTGMFIKSQIDIKDPMEAALISMAVEILLKEFLEQQKLDTKINQILEDLGRDDFENTDIQELAIKYLTDMVESLKVKNEIVTIVE